MSSTIAMLTPTQAVCAKNAVLPLARFAVRKSTNPA
jgi:hypothetical protein